MKMYQVDAFADQLFAGNPAAVLLLDAPMSVPLMQNIAAENNLAETAFAYPKAAGDGSVLWALRWFTPTQEVDFCGHATLAAAHVLFAHRDVTGPLRFQTAVGEITVIEADNGYQLDLPRFAPEPLDQLPEEIAEIFEAPPQLMFRNFENLFFVLESAEAVTAFEPDLNAIAKLGHIGVVITARAAAGSKADFVSRYFVPGAGIPEDPVTGSNHSTLVPYWAGELGRNDLLAYQASERGGWLDCTDTGDRVLVRGTAATFMIADLFLADAAARDM
ncbi:PhzF family phenazine biosynthesis protein [Thalassobius sp. Cn5-15]|jgi:PhzF family phenazine biosynthesis protein|uniref:PhzF family phenazine biosynthesis protein n=1 Tax=Thalassobius sp. Cn5-15 TaxID=2917763 RepID=UPI001EF38AED|nr:PhzF family phenazine biosynthesis protein [Thalassobius sp. Cn5-15]MCG7494702.1 PhzF family phenazine biosynthesis protein [Thalassobius sp. Cn5-15]